jgi:hypothetical protein
MAFVADDPQNLAIWRAANKRHRCVGFRANLVDGWLAEP